MDLPLDFTLRQAQEAAVAAGHVYPGSTATTPLPRRANLAGLTAPPAMHIPAGLEAGRLHM